MRRHKFIATVAATIAAAFTIAACGGSDSTTAAGTVDLSSSPTQATLAADVSAGLPQGSEPATIDPAEFTTNVDNPYFPMSPGSRWVYRETDTAGADEKVVVKVLDKTKTIANGVEAVVVRDVLTENGEVREATNDWYAQDSSGNIWYFGEATAEYKNGKVTTRAGSFEAGVNGAEAGIAVPGNPEPGMTYRQEYDKGNAEDQGAVVTVGDEQVQVPYGFYDKGVLMTRDLVPLEPKVQELKFYAPGVGQLLSVHLDGTGGRAELVDYTPGK
ncbi:MAG: hypothetical protein H0V25_01905 [Solirubrobacterales bacterium]|nr:hypothetical protein [Solirubrobacterales bacterium]